jgi:hypothetical protein
MTCINFIDETNNERLYDSYMIRTRLKMSKSQLQKALNKHDFKIDDYILYKNQFLFKESAILDFIENLIMKRYLTKSRKMTIENLNHIRQSIKEFMRKNELHED